MKKIVLLMISTIPINAVKTSKEMTITYRITEQSSPIDKHKRSRSLPDIETIFHQAPLQLMPPTPPNSPKDLSLDEISVNIPDQTIQDQIKAITKEDKDSNGKYCTPTRLVVVGSICTAIAGVTTAVVTAMVTLIVHFTTK